MSNRTPRRWRGGRGEQWDSSSPNSSLDTAQHSFTHSPDVCHPHPPLTPPSLFVLYPPIPSQTQRALFHPGHRTRLSPPNHSPSTSPSSQQLGKHFLHLPSLLHTGPSRAPPSHEEPRPSSSNSTLYLSPSSTPALPLLHPQQAHRAPLPAFMFCKRCPKYPAAFPTLPPIRETALNHPQSLAHLQAQSSVPGLGRLCLPAE